MGSLIGKTVDSYKILERRGGGGVGEVYKALDTNLEKIVALKILYPFLARDEQFVKDFKNEARNLAISEHPNIVRVHALRKTEIGDIMVMEYVEKDLSKYIEENGPLPLEKVTSVTKQLLSAIGHAHSVDVIHRDIKPSNILICEDGRIKLSDFGLAKKVQPRGPASTQTQTRKGAGTMFYMSPEQVKGLSVDKRSDLYSLGMTVYEMIVGRVPFEVTDSDFTIQQKIVAGDIPSPIKFKPEIPKELTKIILKSIDKDPKKRYQLAEEMLKDINDFETDFLHKLKPTPHKKPIYKQPAFFLSIFAFMIGLTIIYLFIIPPDKLPKALISVSTDPPDAQIILNDEVIGNTPLDEIELAEAEEVKLSINKEGFNSIDTVFGIESGETINLAFILTPTITTNLDLNEVIGEGSLRITSNPTEAEVWLNGVRQGTTPFEMPELTAGTYQLLIKKSGFSDYNRSINIVANQPTVIPTVNLSQYGILTVSSEPSGAEVLINNRNVGRTRFRNDRMDVGEYNISVRKDGFKPYNESIRIEVNRPKNISVILVQLIGKVEILARPWGDIYIDDQLERSAWSGLVTKELPGGEHKLRVVHPSGKWEKTINITGETPQTYKININRVLRLTVTSDSISNAEIFINGNSTGQTTPKVLELRPGNYQIQIKKDGYEPSNIENRTIGYDIYEGDADKEEKIIFKLTKIE